MAPSGGEIIVLMLVTELPYICPKECNKQYYCTLQREMQNVYNVPCFSLLKLNSRSSNASLGVENIELKPLNILHNYHLLKVDSLVLLSKSPKSQKVKRVDIL